MYYFASFFNSFKGFLNILGIRLFITIVQNITTMMIVVLRISPSFLAYSSPLMNSALVNKANGVAPRVSPLTKIMNN